MKNYKFCLFAALVLILPLVPFYLKLTSRGHVCPATLKDEWNRKRVLGYSDYLMIEAEKEDPHIPFLDTIEGSTTNGTMVTMLAIIWNLINQHRGALEKCSGKELLEELAKRSVNGLSKITDS